MDIFIIHSLCHVIYTRLPGVPLLSVSDQLQLSVLYNTRKIRSQVSQSVSQSVRYLIITSW